VQPLVKPQAALERRVQAYLDAIPGAPEGQRDNDAFRVACKLVREFALPDETAMAYLGQWNARCTPPLPATDLRRILASAVKSGSAAFGSKLESQTWVDSAVPVDDGGPGDLRDQLVKTEKGGIKRTPGNLAKILRLDSRWGSHLALNEMSRDLLFKGKVVGDTFVDWVQEQIEDHWGTSWGRDDVAQKLFAQASLQIIHPVRVWLRGLEWDRTERIHRVAQEILGSDSPMATHYLRCTLVGATRRVLYPGTKMDTLPVLEGPQGLGKSTFWRTLAGPKWFSDSPINLEDKDGMMTLHRKWCTELSEIDHATGNKAAERIKAFLSSSEDVFRPPFGKAVQVFPRSCFMVGTTNREGFLVDPSGSRRFWPIKCTKVDQTLLGEWRDQLWAEAMYIHSAGVPHWLDKGQEWLREGEAGQFEAADPWDEQIDTAVKARVLAGKDLSEGYSAAELLDQMGIPVAQQTRALEMRLTALLRKKEWSRRQIGLSRHRRWFP
jgi:putative DNA primase/helicase